MKLIFIRHGEPDYSIDSLTEKGDREAKLLAERISKLDIKDIYVSPLGRAQRTASYTLEKMGREAVCYDWLREFEGKMYKPNNPNTLRICWDWLPKDWMGDERFFDKDKWLTPECFDNTNVRSENQRVIDGIDKVIEEHGYVKEGNLYKVINPNNDTLVFFCHFGVTCVMLGRILNISPMILWHNFCALPTSVTQVVTEERTEGIANFRMLQFGDISHLYAGGEAPSFMARFCECFMNENENHGHD